MNRFFPYLSALPKRSIYVRWARLSFSWASFRLVSFHPRNAKVVSWCRLEVESSCCIFSPAPKLIRLKMKHEYENVILMRNARMLFSLWCPEAHVQILKVTLAGNNNLKSGIIRIGWAGVSL